MREDKMADGGAATTEEDLDRDRGLLMLRFGEGEEEVVVVDDLSGQSQEFAQGIVEDLRRVELKVYMKQSTRRALDVEALRRFGRGGMRSQLIEQLIEEGLCLK